MRLRCESFFKAKHHVSQRCVAANEDAYDRGTRAKCIEVYSFHKLPPRSYTPSVVGGSQLEQVSLKCASSMYGMLYGLILGVTHHRHSLLSSSCRDVRKQSFTRCCVVWGESEYQ